MSEDLGAAIWAPKVSGKIHILKMSSPTKGLFKGQWTASWIATSTVVGLPMCPSLRMSPPGHQSSGLQCRFPLLYTHLHPPLAGVNSHLLSITVQSQEVEPCCSVRLILQ